jgi:hypothetical protein
MIARYRPASSDSELEAVVFKGRRRQGGAALIRSVAANDVALGRRSAPAEQKLAFDYAEAVAEAKEILAQMEGSRGRLMRLGELADKIEARYGEQSLKRFASEIGIAACTLARCRSVFRAWDEKGAPAPISYAVAQELQNHPDKFDLVRKNPNLTKREARKIMHRWRKEQVQADVNVHRREEWTRWFRAVVRHAGEARRDAAISDGRVSPELRQALSEIVEPKLLPVLREAGEALIRLAAYLERFTMPEEARELPPAEAAE